MKTLGPNSAVPPGLSPADAALADRVLSDALAAGTRTALAFAAGVVFVGALLSLLIPRMKVASAHTTVEVLETFDDLEPVVGDPRRILGEPRRPVGGPRS